MNKPSIALLGLLALLLALAPTPARAAGETYGRVAGYVQDATGTPLAEARVTISGPALQQPVTRVTAAGGRFEFGTLPPGEGYVLEVALEPFAPYKKTGIVVRLGQTTAENVALALGGIEETVVVVGSANPILNPGSARAGSVLTAEKVSTTPTFTQVQAIPQLAVGVGPGSAPSSRGGLSRYGKFYVDGMDTTDVSGGSITAPINFYSVENFEVITGGLDAQYNALGMVENVVTKSGSNTFTYDASLILSPSWANAKSQFAARQGTYVGELTNSTAKQAQTSFYSPILNFGGPIVKDRLWYYVSTQLNLSHKETPILDENRPTDTQSRLGRVKLTWQPTAGDRVSLALSLDRNTIDNNIANFAATSVTTDAESRIKRGGYFLIANYDHSFSDSVLFQLQAGTTWKDQVTSPMSGDAIAHRDLSANLTRFGAPAIGLGEEGNYQKETKARFQFDPTLVFSRGPHQMKAGVQLGYLKSRLNSTVLGNTRYVDRTAVACDPADPATYASCNQRIDFYNTDGEQAPQLNDASVLTTGAFLQDRWLITRQLTVTGGLRFDMGRLKGDDGRYLGSLKGFGPRLSATYDLFADGSTLITGHYGRSTDVGDVGIAQQGNPSLVQVTSTWQSAVNAFPTCAPGVTAPNCSTRGGETGTQFLGHQKAPTVDEVSLGLHREFTPGMVAGVDGTYRRYNDLWVDEEVNRVWDVTGTRIESYVDGQAHTIYQVHTSPDAYRDYKGMDLWVQGQSGRWDVLASYTLAFNNGTVGSYFDNYGDNPRLTYLFDGPTADDIRHTVKGAITYSLPFGLDVGVRAAYRTGAAMWMNQSNPGATSESYYRSPRGTGYAFNSAGQPDNNNPEMISELRQPDQLTFDAQLRYDLGHALPLGKNHAELTLQVFNAFNSSAVTRVTDTWSRTNLNYGTAASRLSPLQAQLGLRFRN